MPSSRMNREEFFAKLAPLDAGQRGRILWNLYYNNTVEAATAAQVVRPHQDPAAQNLHATISPPRW